MKRETRCVITAQGAAQAIEILWSILAHWLAAMQKTAGIKLRLRLETELPVEVE